MSDALASSPTVVLEDIDHALAAKLSDGDVGGYHTATMSDALNSSPAAVLASVSEFLTKTERALAAVAMTAPSSSWRASKWRKPPCESGKDMVTAKPLNDNTQSGFMRRWERQKSYEWDWLDFKDVDEELAARLTDDDLGGILVCIDAVNTLKKLKLERCVGILGLGLEPLRGSIVLEQIELGPSVYRVVGVPILDSIIDGRSSLRSIHLPKNWRVEQSPVLRHVLEKYNRVLNRREVPCGHREKMSDKTSCGLTCHASEWMPLEGESYGIQQFSCFECKEMFCEEHRELDTPHSCEMCERVCCFFCEPICTCYSCFRTVCNNCTGIDLCSACEQFQCGDCSPAFYCGYCDRTVCGNCSLVRSRNGMDDECCEDCYYDHGDY